MLIHFNIKGSAEASAILLGRLRANSSIEYAEVTKLSDNVVQYKVKGMNNSGFAETLAQELAEHYNRLIEKTIEFQDRLRYYEMGCPM